MFIGFIVAAAMLALVIVAGLTGYRRSRRPLERFNASRRIHWLPLGASLAASSTSADTPLLVAGAVFSDGLAGNWFWWASAPGVFASLFFFAHLWRRSGVLTDVGIIQLRYGDSVPANWLRGMRAVLEGVVLNVLILASNGYALHLVLQAALDRLGMEAATDLATVVVSLAFVGSGAFVLVIGFRGLVRSGTTEFIMSLLAGVGLAVAALASLPGGLGSLPSLSSARDGGAALAIVPVDGASGPLLLLLVAWWHTAPGRGLMVQRLAAARDERAAILTIGTYSILHFLVRPWSWYIIGLAALAHLPSNTSPESVLPVLAANILPAGFYGILVALSGLAFTGCVTSRLNLGASYLVNDVLRVIFPGAQGPSLQLVELFAAAFLATSAAVLVVTGGFGSMRGLYQFIIVMLAGTGFVAIARWYWWRTSLGCEIASLCTAVTGALAAVTLFDLSRPDYFVIATVANFALGATTTLIVAIMGRPTPDEVLVGFHTRVAPEGPGWRRFASGTAGRLRSRALKWLLANAGLFAAIAACTRFMAQDWITGSLSILVSAFCAGAIGWRRRAFPDQG